VKAKQPAIGIDLGGTNVRAAVVDASGSVLSSYRQPLGAKRDPQSVLGLVCQAAHQAMAQAATSAEELVGVGIGVAAQLRGSSGMVAVAPNLGWREVPFGAMVAKDLGRSVRVVNDLVAICWGEVAFGAAHGFRDVLVVFVGTGVGGGLVLDGQLYQGASGVAAEIGHVKVFPSGRGCGCGGKDCLEAYLGGANLSRRLREEAEAGWRDLTALAKGDPAAIHPGLVEQLHELGDPRAKQLWSELAELFGTVLANSVTLLNPSALVLGGMVLSGCPSLLERSLAVLRRQALAVALEALVIKQASLGDEAGVIGAADLARKPV